LGRRCRPQLGFLLLLHLFQRVGLLQRGLFLLQLLPHGVDLGLRLRARRGHLRLRPRARRRHFGRGLHRGFGRRRRGRRFRRRRLLGKGVSGGGSGLGARFCGAVGG
jgi:hypothetical protein